MDRRTFVLLAGASWGALRLGPADLPPRGTRAPGRLRFTFGDDRRWSLWYQGAGPPVPVIERATLGARIGDRVVTLGELQDIAIGTRRPPAREALVVRGRAADVWIQAEFIAGPAAETPLGAVTVSVYPDRALPLCGGVRFFTLGAAQVVPGPAPLTALVTGARAASAPQIVTVTEPAAGRGPVAFIRGSRTLALACDATDPGDATTSLDAVELSTGSVWTPARPLRPQGDSCTLRLCYDPGGSALRALAGTFEPPSSVDRERLDTLVAPAGWRSWHALGSGVTEAAVLANLAFGFTHFDRRSFGLVQIDDGYQRAAGDWDMNAGFPSGHRALTGRIHAYGLRAGLWLAPFAVTEPSGIPAAHPDWLYHDGDEPVVVTERAEWGGRVFALNAARTEVQHWLYELGRRVVRDWGYDLVEAGELHWAAAADDTGLTHGEACRQGLAALRDGLGPDVFLLADGARLQHASGLVNAMRIGPDVTTSWGSIRAAARSVALRSFYHRRAWINDSDCVLVRPPLLPGEARAWASVVAVAGIVTRLADDLPRLAPERLAILRKALPVAPIAGRPVGPLTTDTSVASGLAVGNEFISLSGRWRFSTADEPFYAAWDYEDNAWETVPAPDGDRPPPHPNPADVTWYRTRVTLPVAPPAGPSAVRGEYVELGEIGDADEVFVNGVRVGRRRASDSPLPRDASPGYRRHPVPPRVLNWGGENVIAVRIAGGWAADRPWTVRRERSPDVWIVEGRPEWWTLVLVNWDDEPRQVTLPVKELGIPDAPLRAHDVWRRVSVPDVHGEVSVAVPPHDAVVLSLRAATAVPQVIGTTRHVVQGALDVRDEQWMAARRALQARATAQGGEAYAVTIAAPSGLSPSACASDPPCAMRRLDTGHVVLEWPPGGDGRDITWELRFEPTSDR